VKTGMACSRKKNRKRPKKGHHICRACGQVRNKSGKLCKPRKIKDLSDAFELLERLEERGRLHCG
jgi:hypothetical protein